MIKDNALNKSVSSYMNTLIDIIHRDRKDFKETVNRFLNQDKNLSQGYLLIRLNNQFARCLRGVEILKHPESDGAFKFASALSRSRTEDEITLLGLEEERKSEWIYLNQLEAMFSQIDQLFSDQGYLSYLKEEIDLLFRKGGEMWRRVVELEENLKKIVLLIEDYRLNDEGYLEDIKHDGLDWIFQFSELYTLAYEPLEMLRSIESYKIWKDLFIQVEQYFRLNFNSFYIFADIWDDFNLHEYKANFWWITEAPKKQHVEKLPNGESFITAIGRLFQEQENITKGCPDFEMIAAYAHHDSLELDVLIAIREHVHQCSACLEHMIEIREAVSETEETQNLPSSSKGQIC